MTRASVNLSRRQVLAASAALAGSGPGVGSAKAAGEPLFDAHAHLVSNDEVRFPRVPADSAGAAANLPPQEFRQFGSARPVPEAEAMLAWMKAEGVEAIAAVQKRGTYGVDNRYILDSAARFPELFFPVVILDAEDDATPGTVRALAKKGLAGVRLTGSMATGGLFPWLASEKALRLWSAAAETGIVIDIMTMPFGDPPQAIPTYADLARRFPSVRMVIDHLNWPEARGEPDYGLNGVRHALALYPNVFFKFTTLNIDKLQDDGRSPAAFLAYAVETLGAQRICWGTDMGNSPGTYAELVGRGRAAARGLSPADQRAVLHDTGRALFTKRAKAA